MNKVNIPYNCSLNFIKGQSFGNCPKLTEFTVVDDDPKFMMKNGVLLNHDQTMIYAYLPSSKNKYYVIPAQIQTIQPYAFQYCTNLEVIVIADGFLNTIGPYAFEGCSRLSLIYLPDTLVSVGQNAFLNCNKLRCGGVRVIDDMKEEVIKQGIPRRVFDEYCPPQGKISCGSSNIYTIPTFLMFIFLIQRK